MRIEFNRLLKGASIKEGAEVPQELFKRVKYVVNIKYVQKL